MVSVKLVMLGSHKDEISVFGIPVSLEILGTGTFQAFNQVVVGAIFPYDHGTAVSIFMLAFGWEGVFISRGPHISQCKTAGDQTSNDCLVLLTLNKSLISHHLFCFPKFYFYAFLFCLRFVTSGQNNQR